MDILIKKEMEYGKDQQIIFMAVEGDYKAVVINRKTHPCAYIQFPGIEQVTDYDNFFVENSRAHGGYTFLGELDRDGLFGTWIGWDYAHCSDFMYYGNDGFRSMLNERNGHVYTIDELSEDALETIKSVIENGFKTFETE